MMEEEPDSEKLHFSNLPHTANCNLYSESPIISDLRKNLQRVPGASAASNWVENCADAKQQSLVTYRNCESVPLHAVSIFVVYFYFFISSNLHPAVAICLLLRWSFTLAIVYPSTTGPTCWLCSSSLCFLFPPPPLFYFSPLHFFIFIFLYDPSSCPWWWLVFLRAPLS